MKRFGIHVAGLVQGVGFRPFLHRLAGEYRVCGSVRNTRDGVLVEAEGPQATLLSFLSDIREKAPRSARIERISVTAEPSRGESSFHILASDASALREGESVTTVPKDLAICQSCLQELRDPKSRRYRYPFITCNVCGPRYTIADRLPFDREQTAMADFPMCTACSLEFTSPLDRRFHAQTISCPECGPSLTWTHGEQCLTGAEAFQAALRVIKAGGVIAVKGIGGFQLLCLARDHGAVEHVRQMKHRPMKPMAVMAPHLEAVRFHCELSPDEEGVLQGPAAPIVLLRCKNPDDQTVVSSFVAPGTSLWGVMLPHNPLYAMLADDLGEWLVVTSANQSGAPTVVREEEIREWAPHFACGILSHNRRIAHLADDSVVRMCDQHMILLRHGRGLAPTEISSKAPSATNGVGLGAHQKGSFAIRAGSKLVLSPYIGDWEHPATRMSFLREWATLSSLYGLPEGSLSNHELVACDEHGLYGPTRLATELHPHPRRVQHHAAHLQSLIMEMTGRTEQGYSGRALGVVWDGTGLGSDGTMWGGEFFLLDGGKIERIASIHRIPLWGGDQASREPRRTALSLVWEASDHHVDKVPFWSAHTSPREEVFLPMAFGLQSGMVPSSSIGRLFDGLAFILGIDTSLFYEAQAPMALEALAASCRASHSLNVVWEYDESGLLRWDWRPLVRNALLCETASEKAAFAATFHRTLVKVMVELAHTYKVHKILLTGGVFQNALLLQLCFAEGQHVGLEWVTHGMVPPGDGGIALGQLSLAERM